MSCLKPIIAAITLNFLVGVPISAQSGVAGFAAYTVRLEVIRNGVYVAAPPSTLAAGESGSVELVGGARQGTMRAIHRVTGFPGSGDSRALLELELYGLADGRSRRIVAPTLGVELGVSELYELRTEQGLMRITATVEGIAPTFDEPSSALQTFAHPTI